MCARLQDEANLASSKGPNWSWTEGDAVAHPTFETGTVLGLRDEDVEIAFASDGFGFRRFTVDAERLSRMLASRNSRIVPRVEHFDLPGTFFEPPSAAERRLVDALHERLSAEWTIYVHPTVGASQFSVALLSPARGLVFLQVREPTSPVSAIQLLAGARKELFGLAVPALGEWLSGRPDRFERVRTMQVYEADFISHEEADALASKIAAGSVGFPLTLLPDLDRVLGDQWHDGRALESLSLSREQERLATPSPGLHLIRGVAGSGKSLVIAYRAAMAARAGKRVLLLTFNGTLVNYLDHLVSSVPVRYRLRQLTLTHIHGLCADLVDRTTVRPPHLASRQEQEARDRYFDVAWPEAALEALGQLPRYVRYDACYVDEGQDFADRYFDLIQAVTYDPKDIVFAVDDAQALYGRKGSFYPKLRAPRGAWMTHSLPHGRRLPAQTAELANAIAQRYDLPSVPIERPPPGDEGFNLATPTIALVPTGGLATAAAAALTLVQMSLSRDAMPPTSLAVLVPSNEFGAALVQLFAEHGIRTNHTFELAAGVANREANPDEVDDTVTFRSSAKDGFEWDDERLKVTTIHSFKGWESERTIVVLPNGQTMKDARIAYVSLTRSRGDVYVVTTGRDLVTDKIPVVSDIFGIDVDAADRFEALLGAHAEFVGTLRDGTPATEPIIDWTGFDLR